MFLCLCFSIITFQTPTIHGIEFTWERVKKKLDLDGCDPSNATGIVTTFHTHLEQSKTESNRHAAFKDNATLRGRKAEQELQQIQRKPCFQWFFCCYCKVLQHAVSTRYQWKNLPCILNKTTVSPSLNILRQTNKRTDRQID